MSGMETARGHEEPFARQFSVFLANRIGQLRELLDLLLQARLHVVGLCVIDSVDWAVVRLVVSEPEKARACLRQHAVPFTELPVLLIELGDDNAFAEVCLRLTQAEIGVHFAYPLTLQSQDHPVMALAVDDPVLAGQTLIRHGFTLLGHEDLPGPDR